MRLEEPSFFFGYVWIFKTTRIVTNVTYKFYLSISALSITNSDKEDFVVILLLFSYFLFSKFECFSSTCLPFTVVVKPSCSSHSNTPTEAKERRIGGTTLDPQVPPRPSLFD